MRLSTHGDTRPISREIFGFVSAIKVCSEKEDLNKGTKLHADVVKRGLLETSAHLINSLIHMYAKCGVLTTAQQMHDEHPARTVISWNALISGYAAQQEVHAAARCLQQMQVEGTFPNSVTFVGILKACGSSTETAYEGKQIHEELIIRGFLRKSIIVSNALIHMYGQFGMLAKAQEIIEIVPVRDVVSWSSLITAYVKQSKGHKALDCFELMRIEGLLPDAITFNSVLNACSDIGAINIGKRIHDDIENSDLIDKNVFIGASLVNLYAKCGMLVQAQEVLERLPLRDVATWSAIIAGHAQQRNHAEALNTLEEMENDGILPNAVTYICIVKACRNEGDIDNGRKFHREIASRGFLEKDDVLSFALVDLYTKCGDMEGAQQLHDQNCHKSIDSWNVLVAGYVQHFKDQKALKCLEKMQRQGFSPDVSTWMCILKACVNMGTFVKFHDEIVNSKMHGERFALANAVVDKYDAIANVHEVQYEVFVPNAISWSATIAGYVQHGQECIILKCFLHMLKKGYYPDGTMFACVLRQCSNTESFNEIRLIHNEVVCRGLLEESFMLGSALVNIYSKCGELRDANHVNNRLHVQTAGSWNARIAGYAKQGHSHDALNCFEQMLSEGVLPDAVTFVCLLGACSDIGDGEKAREIHQEIIKRGLLENNSILGTALVNMYAKCARIEKAEEVIEGLSVRDVFSWSALISGYIQQGQSREALVCFQRMQLEGICPDEVAFISILKACGSIRAIEKGHSIHDEVLRRGFLEKSNVLGNALVDMYVKCGSLTKAQQVLQELPLQDVVSWSTIIAGYAEKGQDHKALKCFEQMQRNGITPNAVTFVSILKTCGRMGNIDKGTEIHEEITRRNLLNYVTLFTALVGMYAKCGMFTKAQNVLKQVPYPDTISWNALIAEYAHNGRFDEALNCYEDMKSKGISPNVVTRVCILKACSSKGAIHKGEQIHQDIINLGLFKKDITLGNAVVDMYAKCGMLTRAEEVLEEIPVRDVVSWNALIAGYARQNQGHDALRCFQSMQEEGIFPDAITFLCLLNACSLSGLLQEAQMCFRNMSRKHGMAPILEHHTCLVTGLGCTGQLYEAMSMIKTIPSVDSPICLAVLDACRKWGNMELGGLVLDHSLQCWGHGGTKAFGCQ